MIRGVDPSMIPRMWPKVWSVLARAFTYDRDEISEEKVYNELKSGHMQLWVDIVADEVVAAGTTQIVNLGEIKVCKMLAFSSEDHEAVTRFQATIEYWARYQKCDELEMTGRHGWLKRGQKSGFKLKQITMVKTLGEDNG